VASPGTARSMTVRLEHVREPADRVPAGWPSPPDPGDLGKRIAWRRTQLRLSVAQVAARAKVSPRYLEYLERYPAMPGPATLRALAAALQTTTPALLGAGGQAPPRQGQLEGGLATEKLTAGECRRLLAPGGIGRVAVATASGLAVLPVNFAMVAGTIVFRTGGGTLIAAHCADDVAFEVDHIDESLGQAWSVLVRGPAHRVAQPGELHNLLEQVTVTPWAGGEREVYIRIVPARISGRRVGPAELGTGGGALVLAEAGPAPARDGMSAPDRHPGRWLALKVKYTGPQLREESDMPGIVVGFDGSVHARQALKWAISEAAIRRTPLTVLTVQQAIAGFWGAPVPYPGDEDLVDHAAKVAREETDSALEGLSEGQRPPSVTVQAAIGMPAEEILMAAQDADMIVVGSRGAGGFKKLLMGSVGLHITHHAHCPVVVIPADSA
jgi:nucleotide-binding universal stress UspA family protein/transcriptional regulator with XRE-family HTH domain